MRERHRVFPMTEEMRTWLADRGGLLCPRYGFRRRAVAISAGLKPGIKRYIVSLLTHKTQ